MQSALSSSDALVLTEERSFGADALVSPEERSFGADALVLTKGAVNA